MALRIRRRMRILVFGDSRTNSGSTGETKWWIGLRDYFRALWGADAPTWIQSGVVNEDTTAAVARLSAGCYVHAPDLIINAHGVIDCINAVANATTTTNLNSIITGQKTVSNYSNRTAPVVAFCEVPMCGEKWPNGANPFDTVATGIDAKNALIATACTTNGAELLKLRAGILAWETANNPANTGSSLLTIVSDGTTGRHETALGATVEANIIIPQLQIDP